MKALLRQIAGGEAFDLVTAVRLVAQVLLLILSGQEVSEAEDDEPVGEATAEKPPSKKKK